MIYIMRMIRKRMRMIRILTLCLIVILPLIVSAYTLLEPLPIGGGAKIRATGLTDYLSWLFRFMLVAAAFLAIIQIVIGGIQMIIGGASETARTSAKSRIQDAIYGLLLALASWLILWTINPDLAQMKLTIPEVTIKVTAPSTTPTTPSTTCGGDPPNSHGGLCPGTNSQGIRDSCAYRCPNDAPACDSKVKRFVCFRDPRFP